MVVTGLERRPQSWAPPAASRRPLHAGARGALAAVKPARSARSCCLPQALWARPHLKVVLTTLAARLSATVIPSRVTEVSPGTVTIPVGFLSGREDKVVAGLPITGLCYCLAPQGFAGATSVGQPRRDTMGGD